MNLPAIKELLKEIEASKGDAEAAHSLEKDLWEAVLNQIASSDFDAQFLAKEALRSRDIDFPRWYA